MVVTSEKYRYSYLRKIRPGLPEPKVPLHLREDTPKKDWFIDTHCCFRHASDLDRDLFSTPSYFLLSSC